MTQILIGLVPVVFEKALEWGHDWFINHAQQACAAKCAAASKAGFTAGVKVGLLYGAGGVLLLVVVVRGMIFVIKQMQQCPKFAYGI
ncbi:MAG TPA: hypothetical protein DDW76_29340 [Cyanobacteria bacterium UBA11369]|nr:hypothetical protein [Cyanobacteria bacterium UBA11371]HBE31061.1 hypothetical protein [Cyanobacteria bacterium UBA11368]HBE52766.1 hypothetical protein [Cyanobacteria bacterium UBA11369]